jgi:hypothetical protein
VSVESGHQIDHGPHLIVIEFGRGSGILNHGGLISCLREDGVELVDEVSVVDETWLADHLVPVH